MWEGSTARDLYLTFWWRVQSPGQNEHCSCSFHLKKANKCKSLKFCRWFKMELLFCSYTNFLVQPTHCQLTRLLGGCPQNVQIMLLGINTLDSHTHTKSESSVKLICMKSAHRKVPAVSRIMRRHQSEYVCFTCSSFQVYKTVKVLDKAVIVVKQIIINCLQAQWSIKEGLNYTTLVQQQHNYCSSSAPSAKVMAYQ